MAHSESALTSTIFAAHGPWVRPLSAATRLTRRQPLFVACGAVLVLIAGLALAAPFVTPYGPNDQSLIDGLLGPSRQRPFGTDQLGRDIFSRTLYAGRVSLAVGFGVMLLGGGLAALLGGFSGFRGGWVDGAIQRLVDAFLSIPTLVLLMTVLSVIGTSLTKMILAMAIWAMVSSSRTVRGAVLTVKTRQYGEAARSVGARPGRVFLRHVLPNVAATIIVIATLLFGIAVTIEATLSFLGFGVPPPTPTWGGMLAGDSRSFLTSAPWLAIAPGAALTTTVIAINLFGDGLRDILDPRLRGKG